MPDADLVTHIVQELTINPYTRQYKLAVTTDNGTIIMTGTVRCYYHKQMANEAVRKILQNTNRTTVIFKNNIAVVPEA